MALWLLTLDILSFSHPGVGVGTGSPPGFSCRPRFYGRDCPGVGLRASSSEVETGHIRWKNLQSQRPGGPGFLHRRLSPG